MNSLLYFILFTVAFYYIFKYSMRWLLPFAMRKLAERMMKKAQQSQYTYTNTGGNPFGQQNPFENSQYKSKSAHAQDAKVKVDYVPAQEEKRTGPATAGEFIDFEEVK